MTDQTELWAKFARIDLQSADILLREEIYSQVCFHCQQCVEKAFKAVIVHQNVTVPKVHSIVTLFELLPSDLTDEIDEDVSQFDDFYIPVRYPDTIPGSLPDGLPGKSEADAAFQLATDILNIVEQYFLANTEDNSTETA